MANNYTVIQHNSNEYQGDSTGTNSLPTVFLTIEPDDGYMIKAHDFSINGVGGFPYDDYVLNGETEYHKRLIDSSTLNTNLQGFVDITGVDDQDQDIINEIVLENI